VKHIRSIGKRSQDILAGELRIFSYDFLGRHAIGQAADDDLDGDPSAFDTGITVMQIGRHLDVVLPACAICAHKPVKKE